MNQFEWVGERLVSDRGQPWIGAFERLFPGGEKRYQAGASRHARSTAGSSIGLPLRASLEALSVSVMPDAADQRLAQKLAARQRATRLTGQVASFGACESARDHPRRSVTLAG